MVRGGLARRHGVGWPVTTVERMAEAMAGPDDWARFSPRARNEYRRMAIRGLKVLRRMTAIEEAVIAIDAVLAEDADE